MRETVVPPPFVLAGRRVLTADGLRPAAVTVRDGRIAEIAHAGGDPAAAAAPAGLPVRDLGERVLMAGLVDSHVHVNEPGRSEWEGFATATRAAAAGGVTTLVDMPLNSIPATTTAPAMAAKARAAAGRCRVDVGLWGGLVPGNAGDGRELAALWEAGVLGFKCFLVPSGVDEFAHVGEAELARALPLLARLGSPLLVHAELPGPIAAAAPAFEAADPSSYAAYLASRPPAAEIEAIDLVLRLAAASGARVHIVHLAAAAALERIGEARRRGVKVSVETCPHYLTFAAEEIADGATEHKCAPPIRGRDDRERLWRALAAGEIDLVASDHSPSPPALKHRETGDFRRAWGGIASLQLLLPAVWTGARERGLPLERLGEWLAAGPASLAGLAGRKGALALGYDADLVVWDPEASFRVEPRRLHHRHPLTPYAGRTLYGVVETTYLRGAAVYDRGVWAGEPTGILLERPDESA